MTEISLEAQELLLHSARNGDIVTLESLLRSQSEGRIKLDVNCKGKTKSNMGWTPLHLASYFGHKNVVQRLLDAGADIDAVNDAGDTPLHKAAFIGREDLVLLLLEKNADVNVRNGEGRTPRDVCRDGLDAGKLLWAAERTDMRKREERLLAAARDGQLDVLKNLLKDERAPSINCVDNQGNSCLHCAAYRGHKEAAILLLQNGIDTTIKNVRGQTALQLARDTQMEQVLAVQPVRHLQKTATRFEGQLLKRSRFLGWKPVWTVLERGVLTYFNSRADATSGVKRKDFKYLDGARSIPAEVAPSAFNILFNDGAVHRLSVPLEAEDITGEVNRQKWIAALNEHSAFSSYYVNQGKYDDSDDEEELKPLGSMQDSLQTASARYQLLETKLNEITTSSDLQFLNSDLPLHVIKKFDELQDTANNMLSALSHCYTLIQQQEDVRILQLKQEQEKCRVLEEALSVLAKEHHDLEQSMASHFSNSPQMSRHNSSVSLYLQSPRFYDMSDDEFYDAFEAGSISGTENLVTAAATPDSDSDTLVGVLSPASSCATLVSVHSFRSALECNYHSSTHGVHTSRQCLPAPMFSRNDFSLWSVLKNSIGKELDKIVMPVVFNEPLSFLQRLVEHLEYSHLVRSASEQTDPVVRLQYVAAFAVSALASSLERLGKPFNPLLGETYELERDQFRVVCEQVSHHPPISAFHADSEHFIFHGSVHPKLKFWGKSVEIQPKGVMTLELPKWGEAYSWSSVNCCVHNIIVGKLWIEQYGTMEIVNHSTGHKAILTFKPAGWFSKDLHRVEGFIMDKHKKKLNFLYGKWTDFIRCTDIHSYDEYVKENADKFRSDGKSHPPNMSESPVHTPKKVLAKLNSLKMGAFKSMSISEPDETGEDGAEGGDIPKSDSVYSIDIPHSVTLWEAEPRPPNTSDFYHFTLFAMSLNELEDGMEKRLCPTDCRLRPDIRKLESGDLDGAAAEKLRLEEKQRDTRKLRKNKKIEEWTPVWFSQGANPYTGQQDWLYRGGYWDRNFGPDPRIF
ncbi:hypothetical protein LSTR_LSTR012726 [Laodelphax striatellus]|uniref:Oxysterol-binding protein n=1 Tax=Laodelphax striatellus TaxID=195883 RepID=A0A482WMA9_LAOST|nr:hypothetical protein LSTR_LSTR012726 [Laodelphax striatellus]